MGWVRLFQSPLGLAAGSKYTTSAPDYSQWSAADYLATLTILVAVIGFLFYVLSALDKRRRR